MKNIFYSLEILPELGKFSLAFLEYVDFEPMTDDLEDEFYTPSQLLKMYPDAKASFNIKLEDFKVYIRSSAIVGYENKHNNTYMVSEISFRKFLNYLNDGLESRKVNLNKPRKL